MYYQYINITDCFIRFSTSKPVMEYFDNSIVNTRDESVQNMCTSGGRQCKTVPIQELHVLLHPKQTWTFPLNEIAIKVPKCTKYETNLCIFFKFVLCFQYFKISFCYMC